MVRAFQTSSKSVYSADYNRPSTLQFKMAILLVEHLSGRTELQFRLSSTPVICVGQLAVSIDSDGQLILFDSVTNEIIAIVCPVDFNLVVDFLLAGSKSENSSDEVVNAAMS